MDWPHLVSQIVSFGIVCLVLYRFAYRPILTMLEARREQISQGLANAEQIRAELARTEAQRHAVMVQANTDAANVIEEARAAAARLQDQQLQKAIATSQQIILKSREQAAVDYARMLAELRQEVGGLVVRATAMVTEKILTAEDHRRLAEEAEKHLMA